MVDFAAPWNIQQCYQFDGYLTDPGEPHQHLSLTVLAGPTGPVPTQGWAKINTIDRAHRKGYTMPVGYDPLGMDVAIRFEAMTAYSPVGTGTPTMPGGPGPWTPAQLETSIQVLEWMAGRGKLYANGTHPASGDPPQVQVSSFQSTGVATNLIPPNFHSNGVADLRWLITNLQFSTDAIRGRLGDRHRQDITVSLIEYVAVPGAPVSARQRQQQRGTSSGFKTFTIDQAHNTIAKLCLYHGINTSAKWTQVVSFNQKRLRIRSYSQTLKPGTKVQIPLSILTP